MARFRGCAGGLSPLAIQLKATTSTVRLMSWYAGVETQAGIATVVSRPVITRPSLLGTPAGSGASTPVGVSNPAAVATAELLTAFGTPPSFPAPSLYTTLAPFSASWAAGSDDGGLLVFPGSAILLFAQSDATVGAAWNAYLEWDEA